jgi:hypothetical protein
MNTQDLARIIEDLRYIIQSGGNPFALSGGGIGDGIAKFGEILKSILIITVFIFIAYYVYIILRKGYPKVVYDLITLSIFKRENLDKLFREYSFMLKHYKVMVTPIDKWRGMNPYEILNVMTGNSVDLQGSFADLDYYIASQYGQYKNDEKYYEAFKYIYKFYNTVSKRNFRVVYIWPEMLLDENFQIPLCDGPEIESKIITPGKKSPCLAPQMRIRFYDFYEGLANTLVADGKMKAQTPSKNRNMSNDELVAKVFYFDNESYISNQGVVKPSVVPKNMRTNYRAQIEGAIEAFETVAIDLNNIMNFITKYPFSLYIRIPEDDATKGRFVGNYSQHSESIYNLYIYDNKINYRDIEEFSWYIFEALAAQPYAKLSSEIGKLLADKPPKAYAFITAYLGQPIAQRLKFFHKIILSFPDLVPNDPELDTWDAKRGWFKRNYTPLIDYVNKHPIFAHLYFNTRISNSSNEKDHIYKQTILAYEMLMCTNKDGTKLNKQTGDSAIMISNLMINGSEFKELISSIGVMHLFFVEYRELMTKLYEEQNVSTYNFFDKLWRPYKDEIWDRKIMEYYRRIFEKSRVKRTYGRFLKPWRLLGDFIADAKSKVWNGFDKSTEMPDDPPPESDNQGAEQGTD